MAKTAESNSKRSLFRDLDSKFLIGTASDGYAGWIGQIYSKGRYEKREVEGGDVRKAPVKTGMV